MTCSSTVNYLTTCGIWLERDDRHWCWKVSLLFSKRSEVDGKETVPEKDCESITPFCVIDATNGKGVWFSEI